MATCTEYLPPGASKPTLTVHLPATAKAGELVTLQIQVRHGAGETATLPADLPLYFNGTQLRLVDEANWGRAAAPQAVRDPNDSTAAVTTLQVPLVALPTDLQRSTLKVPPLRVIVLRRGGGDISTCTEAQTLEVDQPTASTPNPAVRPNPGSVEQITRNERLQDIVLYGLGALVVGALLAALISWLLRRPKAPPKPKPKPAPWTVALDSIRQARSDLAMGRVPVKVYYDRLSDALRAFLGAMYGFDGLESTTDETLSRLRRQRSPILPFDDVVAVLTECDLVKFASQTRTAEEGMTQASVAEGIVRRIGEARRGLTPDGHDPIGPNTPIGPNAPYAPNRPNDPNAPHGPNAGGVR